MLRTRWLGQVSYHEAEQLQRALHARATDDYLLLLEHPHVYTLGTTADPAHVLAHPADVGAALVHADRGGDVTYHGPGQLVGYPIVTLPDWRDGLRDVVAYVRSLEGVLIAALATFGITAHREPRYPGVWVGDEKIAAIGVKVARGRTRHGFALNVDPDLSMFAHIVPCGIRNRGVTSLARVLGEAPDMRAVVDAVVAEFARSFAPDGVERQDVVWRERPEDLSSFTRESTGDATPVRLLGRLAEAGVEPGTEPAARRPEWMRVRADLGAGYRETKRLMRELDLHTVCEEAGCPEHLRVLGRPHRDVHDPRRPVHACVRLLPRRHAETATARPRRARRVAAAVAHLGLEHAVITSVARDDLPDGGAAAFAATIRATRTRTPTTRVEVLIPDCKGDPDALDVIFDARPDVLNHNLETVARLQRAARPSAAYARSLAVLARAKDAGLRHEVGAHPRHGRDRRRGARRDRRPAQRRGRRAHARPVPATVVTASPGRAVVDARRVRRLRRVRRDLGFDHVESGPLVRSSYHAKQGAAPTRLLKVARSA